MGCLDERSAVEFVDGRMAPGRRAEVIAHIASCAECRQLVAVLARTSSAGSAPTLASTDAATSSTLHSDTDATSPTVHGDPAGSPSASRSSSRTGGDHDRLLVVDWDHYAIGDELARGGMGRILQARDRRLGRPVAIKELRSGSEPLRRRFEREARITAKLQHPSIVGVLEAGEWPNGEPFIAMRLVAGSSLDKVIAERATLDERLALLPNIIAVADALAYAHDLRIIHRDLKPHNILLGDYGETVVIDWGLAKELSDSVDNESLPDVEGHDGETVAGSVLGTPAYMPEEQARGSALDERADVYAIGAILYHVLSGVPPYTAGSSHEIVKAVIAGPPPALDSRLGIPRDLLTIVDKAMARDPADRYPSAKELATDLRKFQTGQLVAAHRYSRGELFRRWVRRHRVAVGVAVASTALIGVIGAASILRIVREQARTEEQRKSAVEARGEAEDLLAFMLVDLREKLVPIGKLDVLDAVASKAVAYYERRPSSGDDSEERRRGLARTTIGDVLVPRGDLPAALVQYRSAIAIHEARLARAPDDLGRQTDLADARLRLAAALQGQNKFDEARIEAHAAVTLLAQRAMTAPTETLLVLSRSHERLALLLEAKGEIANALVSYRASLAVADAIAARNADDLAHAWMRIAGNSNIGDALRQQNDITGASEYHHRALAIAEDAARREPTNTRWKRGMGLLRNKIGDGLLDGGKPMEALAEYRAGLAIVEALARHDAANTEWKLDVWRAHIMVAGALRAANDLPGALSELTIALAIISELTRHDPTNTDWQRDHANTHERVGTVRRSQGDLEGALVSARAALAITSQLVAANPNSVRDKRDLSIAHEKIAFVHRANGDLGSALDELRASLAISEELAALDPSDAQAREDLSVVHESIGDVLLAQKDPAAALAEHRRSVEILESLLAVTPTNPRLQGKVANARTKVGQVLHATGDNPAALEIFRSVVDIRTEIAKSRPDDLAAQRTLVMAQNNLGTILAMTGDHPGGLRELRAALAGITALAAADPTNVQLQDILASIHEGIGEVLVETKDHAGALAELEAALAIRERLLAIDPSNAPAKEALAYVKKLMRCCR